MKVDGEWGGFRGLGLGFFGCGFEGEEFRVMVGFLFGDSRVKLVRERREERGRCG